MSTAPILALSGARATSDLLPDAAMELAVTEGDFVLIEIQEPRQGGAFGDLCAGLEPLDAGEVRFLGRDWRATPDRLADALRGRIGRLFQQPLREDTPDVAARVLLARSYHTRVADDVLRAEATALALRFGLPGLPAGPARLLSDTDLLRAACVRAFLGEPLLVVVELPPTSQEDTLLDALLGAGAAARSRGAGVIWLAMPGPALRERSIAPTLRLRLSDAELAPVRSARRSEQGIHV